jgi:parallel beta-helix repeat protein
MSRAKVIVEQSVVRIITVGIQGPPGVGISQAYVDAGDAASRQRSNHTGTQTSSTISDFATAADARIAVQKGFANGVATLDSNAKIPTAQLPALAITDTFPVASQAAMLALTAEVGDVAVRTDLNKSFILKTAGASTLGNWQELLTPTDAVLSVNGQTGAVSLTAAGLGALVAANNLSDVGNAATARTNLGLSIGTNVQAYSAELAGLAALSPSNDDIIQRKAGAWATRSMAQIKTDLALSKSDVGLGSVDNTSDLSKPVSTATQSVLDLKAPLASPAFTGAPTGPTASAGTSTTQLATTAFVAGEIAGGATPDATTLVKGKVQLAGDLAGTASSPTVKSRTATITVATSQSGFSADYICDANTNDQSTTTQTIINNALSAVSAAGGGTVRLRVGTYYVKSSGILVPDNCTLEGEGFSTIISRSDGSAFPATIHNEFYQNADSGSNTGIVIRDLMLDGNSAGSSNPGGDPQNDITLTGVTKCIIENVYISDSADSAIVLGENTDSFTKNTIVKNCIIDTTVDIGIYMSNPNNCLVTGNIVRNTASYGIRVIRRTSGGCKYNTVSNNKVYNCGQTNSVDGIIVDGADLTSCTGNQVALAGRNGIHSTGAAYLNITGNYVGESDLHGIFMDSSPRSAVTGNVVYQASRQTSNTYSGIALNSSSDCTVTGNRSGDNGTGTRQKYGIEEQGTSNNNVISGNVCDRNATGEVHVVGADTIYSGNSDGKQSGTTFDGALSFTGTAAADTRTNLGLVIGTDVQAYDADLATLAGLTATTDNFIIGVSSAWASRTPAQARTSLGLGTAALVADSTLMHLAGAETVTGAKTYSAGAFLDKGNHVFNVKAYGALGDGSTDDTTAIRAAITAATSGGGIVFFPAGTYAISNYLALPSNVWLVGVGEASVIKQISGSNIDTIIRGTGQISHSGLDGLLIDYNHQNNPLCSQGMSFGNQSSYLTVQNCHFKNAKGFAISFTGQPTTRNDHITVRNNTISDILSTPNDMLLVVSDYGIVTNNRVIGSTANISIVLYESDYLYASGNVVEIGNGNINASGISCLSLRYSTVTNNKVVGIGTTKGYGMRLITEHDNGSPITSTYNLITGNFFYSLNTGMSVDETTNDIIQGNRFTTLQFGVEFPLSGNPAPTDTIIRHNAFNDITFVVNNGTGLTSTQLGAIFKDNYGYSALYDSVLLNSVNNGAISTSTATGSFFGRSTALGDTTVTFTRASGEGDPSVSAGTVALFQSNGAAGFSARIGIIAGTTGSAALDFGDKDAQGAGSITWNNSTNKFNITGGPVGIGITPTALLTLPAGTATAGTAPLKLTAGTNLTSPEAGAVEWDGTKIYVTASSTRHALAYTDSPTFTGTIGMDNGISFGGGATTIQNNSSYILLLSAGDEYLRSAAGNGVHINDNNAGTVDIAMGGGAVSIGGTITMSDAKNIAFNTATGTKIGTSTSQKLAFFNATPVVQPTGNLLTALANLGLVASPSIAAGDIPTLNQNTTGTASNVTGTVAIANGGTGQTSASSAFNALSPMTTAGDIIYGGTSGAGTRLAAGTSSQVLIGGTAPSWGAVALASMVSGTLPVANGGTGVTSSTGSGNNVLSASPTFTGTVTMAGGISFSAGAVTISNNSSYILLLSAADHYIRSAAGSAINLNDNNSGAVNIATGGGAVSIGGTVTMTDAKNIVLGSTTGTKIGTATTQKLGFYNATPVIQPSTTGTTSGFTAGAGSAVDSAATFTGNTGSIAYTIGDIVKALKTLGLLAA